MTIPLQNPPSADGNPDRLLSLDVFRGLCVIAMMLVDWPGSWDAPRLPLFEHAHWLGIAPPDFIFPSFLFIMGVAIPFAFARKQAAGMAPSTFHRRILVRAAVLFALGYLLNIGYQQPGPLDLSKVNLLGTLQRYAIIYPIAALLYLHAPVRRLVPIVAAILLAYWAVMTLIPVPGFGPPDLTQYPTGETTPNLAAWIDKTVIGHRLYEYPFEPEGLLNTFPAIAGALMGVTAGHWLRDGSPRTEQVNRLFAWGVSLAMVGYAWGLVFPWAKKMWTSSFVVFMTGWGLLFLAALIVAIDINNRRSRLLELPRWFGINALGALVIFALIDCVTASIPVGRKADHSLVYLKEFLFDHLFRSWLPDRHASWVYSVVAILLLSLLFRWFAERKIYLKI